jgi:hypothetical protein
VVLDLIQVPPPVHTVGVDMAPVGVGSAQEDAQSKGVGVGVRIGVRVQLCKWWRRLGIRWRRTSSFGHWRVDVGGVAAGRLHPVELTPLPL